ncbi:MAG: NADP oxidoreductase [Mycobacterium sp.]|nr:MAG: NADP oxidoreductase [Mycobacterium sp.]PJE02104.1 MAG: NADP oxidoreductase [Mycobacterium sp.]PJE21755.1 MAG: NADP oxidoreductase [Mycobacterium sp.]
MRIAVLGTGAIGGALGGLLARAGHQVVLGSRHPEQVAPAGGPTVKVASVQDAIGVGDVVIEALPFKATMALPASPLTGKILISASNFYAPRDGELKLNASSQTEALANRLPGARVVKAFNMMFAEEMQARLVDPSLALLAIFMAGDDAGAKQAAAELIRDAGFDPIDTGGLAAGRLFETGAPLYAQRWSAQEARRHLAAVQKT